MNVSSMQIFAVLFMAGLASSLFFAYRSSTRSRWSF